MPSEKVILIGLAVLIVVLFFLLLKSCDNPAPDYDDERDREDFKSFLKEPWTGGGTACEAGANTIFNAPMPALEEDDTPEQDRAFQRFMKRLAPEE